MDEKEQELAKLFSGYVFCVNGQTLGLGVDKYVSIQIALN
jgi:hypothetical protein